MRSQVSESANDDVAASGSGSGSRSIIAELSSQSQQRRTGTASGGARPRNQQVIDAISRAAAPRPRNVSGPAANPDHCPACREQFASLFAASRQSESGSAEVGVDRGTKSVRVRKVESAIMQKTSDRYKLIFRIATVLTGVVPDQQLLPALLELHQDLIEANLARYPGIHFSKWTIRMLKEHYDINNGHIIDPIREILHELKNTNRAIAELQSRFLMPDPDNPSMRIVDHKVVTSYARLVKIKEALLKRLEEYHLKKNENLADAIFSLLTQISRNARENGSDVTSDPRMAAGTLAVGGDMMRSASGGGAGKGTGSAFDFYGVSGY